jgi:penicillin-binding protein 2
MRRLLLPGLVLTLCGASGADLHSAVDRAMAGKPGVALVADVATGAILAGYRVERARALAASPGSTLKPFTLAAWMEQHGGASPAPWACPRHLRLMGRRLDCTHPVLAMAPDAASALAYSCNCYFAHLALDLKPAEFARGLRRIAAQVSTASTPEELQLQAIGEWGIEVTPMELLFAYRRLARDRRPAPVIDGLQGAVEFGSAQMAAAPGVRVAGKTGTGTRHCWFAGFTADFVVVVFLEQGRGGSDAAPVAGEIFRALGQAKTPAPPNPPKPARVQAHGGWWGRRFRLPAVVEFVPISQVPRFRLPDAMGTT